MTESVPSDGGLIAANIMHFGRALRAAGLPVGTGRVLDAIRAVETTGLESRGDFYWTLHAVFVSRRDERELFDQAFHVFWRNPKILERMMSLVLPSFSDDTGAPEETLSPRVAAALAGNEAPPREDQEKEAEITFDAAMSWSRTELLGEKDFEKMTAEEVETAHRAMRTMRLPIQDIPTRRFRRDPTGPTIDMRATMRAALRDGGDTIPLLKRDRRKRRPPLVILCDISGSMDRYARMLVHFMHAVTNDRDRVHTFLFGTHLTNVTRYLRNKDIDIALEKVAGGVTDWSGGTRIGICLHDFNKFWSRRVLGQGALLVRHRFAADQNRLAEIVKLVVGGEILRDLMRQLARRRQHQGSRHARPRSSPGQDIDDGQGKGSRFSGPGLRAAQQIPPHEHERNRLFLNRCRIFIARIADSLQQLWAQAQINKTLCFLCHRYSALRPAGTDIKRNRSALSALRGNKPANTRTDYSRENLTKHCNLFGGSLSSLVKPGPNSGAASITA